MALVNLAGEEVTLTILPRASEGESPATRMIILQTLRGEAHARYRAWVEANRQQVHQASGGRVGYVHIPDMKAQGYAEFHRGFLVEAERDGLIVDVRFNTGGNVSELILENWPVGASLMSSPAGNSSRCLIQDMPLPALCWP